MPIRRATRGTIEAVPPTEDDVVAHAKWAPGKSGEDLDAWMKTDAGGFFGGCYHAAFVSDDRGGDLEVSTPKHLSRVDERKLRGLLRASGLFSRVEP